MKHTNFSSGSAATDGNLIIQAMGFDLDALEAERSAAVRAKAEALDHSVPLNVHRWSDHPEVNAFVDTIYRRHFKGRKEGVKRKHVKVLLLHLYAIWCEDPSLVTAFSRNKNSYRARTRYNELHISRLTIDVVDTLIDVGLVQREPGFYDRSAKLKRRCQGRMSRIWPTDALIEHFCKAQFSLFDIGSHQDRLTVILRNKDLDDGDGEEADARPYEVEYEPTGETERMSELLGRYNTLLASAFIDIPELEKPYVVVGSREDGKPNRINISQLDKFVRRVFSRGTFECGGRFFGGWWQRIPKEWRSRIFINDQSTIEIDFSGLHIVMLYAEQGINYWEEVGTDPYEIPVPGFLENAAQARKVAKLLILMLLSAKSDKEAYAAFRGKAPTQSAEKRLTNAQLGQIHSALAAKHPRIANSFGSDVGIKLMNRDARISERILKRFVDRSIPVLLVHDSYIVPRGYENYLVAAMGEAFESEMGVSLANHLNNAMKANAIKEGYEINLQKSKRYEIMISKHKSWKEIAG